MEHSVYVYCGIRRRKYWWNTNEWQKWKTAFWIEFRLTQKHAVTLYSFLFIYILTQITSLNSFSHAYTYTRACILHNTMHDLHWYISIITSYLSCLSSGCFLSLENKWFYEFRISWGLSRSVLLINFSNYIYIKRSSCSTAFCSILKQANFFPSANHTNLTLDDSIPPLSFFQTLHKLHSHLTDNEPATTYRLVTMYNRWN